MCGKARNSALALLAVVLAATLLAAGPPASAAEPTTLTATAPAAHAGQETTVRLTLTSSGTPVAGAPVTVERRVAGVWRPVATVVTDDSGTATHALAPRKDPRDNRVRASYPSDATYEPATVTLDPRLLRRRGKVGIDGPSSFVDERSARTAAGGGRSRDCAPAPTAGRRTRSHRAPTPGGAPSPATCRG